MCYAYAGVLLLMLGSSLHAQSTTHPWQEFVEAKRDDRESGLPDFSYAGYHFCEQPLPDLQDKARYDVTQFGAIANDNATDQDAIQAAIQAAEANGGGVVYLPPGRFIVGTREDRGKHVRISQTGIVLQGSGAGESGTEIHLQECQIGLRRFQFRPESISEKRLTQIVADAPPGSFWVDVASTDGLSVGQTVVITHRSEEYTRWYFKPSRLSPEWTRLFGKQGGMDIREIHTVAEIDGNRVRFTNPMQFSVRRIGDKPFVIRDFPHLSECAIEGIRFTSGWKDHAEEFVHHKNGIHDSGWCAVTMENVQDGWLRDCEFSSVNESLNIDKGYRITVLDTSFTGKLGHTSLHARSGYGVLVKHCDFSGSHWHGPGCGYGSVNFVVTQCSMGVDQLIDSHSGQPMATLFDDIEGGVFRNCGGPHQGLPHHGRGLVFWNFRHRSTEDFHYNFWSVDRRRNYTFAMPVFVGFQADTAITFENEGSNILPGQDVEPKSLFEAQLELRLRHKADN